MRNLVLDPSRVSCDRIDSHGLVLSGADTEQVDRASKPGAQVTLLRPPPNDSLVIFQHEIEHQAAPASHANGRDLAPLPLVVGGDGFLMEPKP
jgi:hypothetical protein